MSPGTNRPGPNGPVPQANPEPDGPGQKDRADRTGKTPPPGRAVFLWGTHMHITHSVHEITESNSLKESHEHPRFSPHPHPNRLNPPRPNGRGAPAGPP